MAIWVVVSKTPSSWSCASASAAWRRPGRQRNFAGKSEPEQQNRATLKIELLQRHHKVIQHFPWKEREVSDVECAALVHKLGRDKMLDVALKLIQEMECEGFRPGGATLSSLMLSYAENGLFSQAQNLWGEIINSSFVPSLEVVSDLMDAYARMGQFDEAGQLEMMEGTIKEMVCRGFKVDSVTANAFVMYYSKFGSLTEMETAYMRLKRSRILIEKEAIRAMAAAYISEKKFYKLGEFMREVGLGRRNTRNLLWNLLLLSYAANFKMKSLQREFLEMVMAGFSPDLTSFNIRLLAFSRMSMFWDLHLSIEHMRHERVVPDLVTFGCIVDAYLNRRLGRNLSFALVKMDVERTPVVSTDPLVFDVFGKGDFHSSSETLLDSNRKIGWTYSKLIAVYLKKQYRSNQIFWNY